MARTNNIFTVPGMLASADLSAKQFYCVKMSTTDNTVSLCDTQGETIFGVLQNKPNASGVAAEVMALGISKVEAGETLTAGDLWGTSASGTAVKIEGTSTGADLADYAAGIVIEGAASGELASVTIGIHNIQIVGA